MLWLHITWRFTCTHCGQHVLRNTESILCSSRAVEEVEDKMNMPTRQDQEEGVVTMEEESMTIKGQVNSLVSSCVVCVCMLVCVTLCPSFEDSPVPIYSHLFHCHIVCKNGIGLWNCLEWEIESLGMRNEYFKEFSFST